MAENVGQATKLSGDHARTDSDGREGVPVRDGLLLDEDLRANGDQQADSDLKATAEPDDVPDTAAREIGKPHVDRGGKVVLPAAVLLLVLLAVYTVTRGIPDAEIVPTELSISIIAADRYVQRGHKTEVALRGIPEDGVGLDIAWLAEKGQIEGSGTVVTFFAPDEAGKVLVTATIADAQGNRYRQSIPLEVYGQFVMLVADNLAFDEATIIPEAWRPFLELIQEEQLKASIGIIGEDIERGNDQFFTLIKALHASGLVEFWNNGYLSVGGVASPLDELGNVFLAGSHAVQKASITRTQDLARANLDLTFHTFGAPGKATGEGTADALEGIEDIRVWLFGDPSADKFVLNATAQIENEEANPSFMIFMEEYDREQPYLLLDIHPDLWDQTGLEQFRRIIGYLRDYDVIFTTPYDYYQTANSDYVTLVCSGCPQVEMQIPVQNSPEGTKIVGTVPQNTLAIVLGSGDVSGVTYYQIVAGEMSGWVSQWFVLEYPAP